MLNQLAILCAAIGGGLYLYSRVSWLLYIRRSK